MQYLSLDVILTQKMKNYFTRGNIKSYCAIQDPIPAGTQRPEDIPLWSYFGREVLCHNKTKIFRFLTYFGSAMSDLHLAPGNIEIFP